MAHPLVSIGWSVLGILLCGGLGATAGFLVTRALGLGGLAAALVGVVIGMVLAVACWAALTSLLRAARLLR